MCQYHWNCAVWGRPWADYYAARRAEPAQRWLASLEHLSADPLVRAAEVALAAIETEIASGKAKAPLEAAYETLRAALAANQPASAIMPNDFGV